MNTFSVLFDAAADCTLAATGLSAAPLVAVAALAIIVGGAGWMLARRRRPGQHPDHPDSPRRGTRAATLALLPLLVLALVAGSTPSPSYAASGIGCPSAGQPGTAPLPPASTTPPTTPPTTAPVDFEPGSAGLATPDPYFPLDGNGGYDVQHYDLAFSYDPATDSLNAVATITAVATQNLSAFNLDLNGLDVASIDVNGSAATFSRDAAELTVTPAAGIQNQAPLTTVVRYSGVPRTIDDAYGPSGFFHTDDGELIVGEPHVASTWFPANDHPTDKASFTFRVTVPSGLQVIANGRLVSETAGSASDTWVYEETAPMTTYLATASVGRFTFDTYSANGISFTDAIDPTLFDVPSDPGTPGSPSVGELARTTLALQPQMISFLESQFGPYPFAEAGGIVDNFDGLGFALENQTRPIYPNTLWEGSPVDTVGAESTVLHELAHQWYGDSVSLGTWRDIWLNEGFATYAEWLWSEHTGGDSPQTIFNKTMASHPTGDSYWQEPPADPGVDGIFDGPVYERGALTLQALRTTVGDTAFFEILRGWASSRAGGSATTADFIRYSEQVSGQNLDAFFQTWLYAKAKPA